MSKQISKNKIEFIAQAAADRGVVEFEKEFSKNLAKYFDYSKGYAESLAIKDSLYLMLKSSISTALYGIIEELDVSK